MINKAVFLKIILISLVVFPLSLQAEVAIVDGDTELLRSLMHTRYMDDNPVLIFAKGGISKRDRLSLIAADIHGLNYVFVDSTPRGMFLELVSDYEIFLTDTLQGSTIEVDKPGVYSIYIDIKDLESAATAPVLSLFIDGRKITDFKNDGLIIQAEYVELAQVSLNKAKHRFIICPAGTWGKKEHFAYPVSLQLLRNDSLLRRELLNKDFLKKADQGDLGISYIFRKKRGEFIIPAKISHEMNYSLEMIMTPSVSKTPVFWDGTAQELQWNFGSLSQDHLWPVIFFNSETAVNNKFPYNKEFRMTAFNPNSSALYASFDASYSCPELPKLPEIQINGSSILSKKSKNLNSMSRLLVTNAFFKPGFNQVTFVFRIDNKKDLSAVSLGNIGIKEFSRSTTGTYLQNVPKTKYTQQKKSIDAEFIPGQSVIMSKDIDVRIEEYPFFDSRNLISKRFNCTLYFIFAVDANDDGIIDGYIQMDGLRIVNLMSLTKEKWPEIEQKKLHPSIKKVLILSYSREDKDSIEKNPQHNILSVNNYLDFFNASSLIVSSDKLTSPLGIKSENVKYDSRISLYRTPLFRDEVNALVKFNHSDPEAKCLKLYIPLDKDTCDKFNFVSFDYSFDDANEQDIRLSIQLEKDNTGEAYLEPVKKFIKIGNHIEIDLTKYHTAETHFKNLVIELLPRNTDIAEKQTTAWFLFKFMNFLQFAKFPYPIISDSHRNQYSELLKMSNSGLIAIDGKILSLSDFLISDTSLHNKLILTLKSDFKRGIHRYQVLENPTFDLYSIIFEQVRSHPNTKTAVSPSITFKKINAAKYLIKVENADKPFWLVFNESYHSSWKLYKAHSNQAFTSDFKSVVAEYLSLGIKEARHEDRFLIKDISFLWRKQLPLIHVSVNGYANGWYFDPIKDLGSSNFTLVMFFEPQAFFYLGTFITVLTFFASFILLLFFRRKYP